MNAGGAGYALIGRQSQPRFNNLWTRFSRRISRHADTPREADQTRKVDEEFRRILEHTLGMSPAVCDQRLTAFSIASLSGCVAWELRREISPLSAAATSRPSEWAAANTLRMGSPKYS
jgi:hypothetical protein